MPFNIILSFFVTTILSSVKLILHPSSASNGIESSSCSIISLKWYAVFAFIDSLGMSNAVVATDSIEWLLAQITLISLWLFFLLTLFGKKCPVMPESATVSIISVSSSDIVTLL